MRAAFTIVMLLASGAAILPGTPGSLVAEETAATVLSRQAAAKWERTPLREALDQLAGRYNVAFFLDRRVNPDAHISESYPESSVRELLEQMGQQQKLGVAPIGSVVYVGPQEAARRIRTLNRLRAREASQLTRTVRRQLLAKDTLTWPDLTTPSELVAQVCRKAGLALENGDAIPHDLWSGNKLVELPRVSQLTLLLVGFDLTLEFTGENTVRLRPIRRDELWEQSYRLPTGHPDLVDRVRQFLPNARLMVEHDTLHVRGVVEDHEVIAEWLKHPGRQSPLAASQGVSREGPENHSALAYTLRVVRRPLQEVLDEISVRTPYRIHYDAASLTAAGVELDRLVSFEVVEADIDRLVGAILKSTGLRFRRDGFDVKVFAENGETLIAPASRTSD